MENQQYNLWNRYTPQNMPDNFLYETHIQMWHLALPELPSGPTLHLTLHKNKMYLLYYLPLLFLTIPQESSTLQKYHLIIFFFQFLKIVFVHTHSPFIRTLKFVFPYSSTIFSPHFLKYCSSLSNYFHFSTFFFIVQDFVHYTHFLDLRW